MSTGTVARRLIELCRAGQFDRALDELYAEDACSIEAEGYNSGPLGDATGLAAIRRKGKAFKEQCLQIKSVLVSDPLIAGPFFTVAMRVNAIYKDVGEKALKEVCVYEVRNDKIVREQFFFENT